MQRFLVEVGHDSEMASCAHAVRVFLSSGSHFLTHAVWGCKDGVHNAWIILEADSKEEARCVVPPAFRSRSRVVGLIEFGGVEQIDGMLGLHQH
jgi:hypothetical protein